MNIYTIIFIILFFIVLAAKPTYILMAIDDEERCGSLLGCTGLIVALFLKIKYSNNVFIISRNQYEQAYEFMFKRQRK